MTTTSKTDRGELRGVKKEGPMQVQIKHCYTHAVLFSAEVDAGLSTDELRLGAAVKLAIKANAYLANAYLARANLTHADLTGANLARANLAHANLAGANLARANFDILPVTPEQAVANLDRVREIILDDEKRLEMDYWHEDGSWEGRSCAEEAVCGTSHCLAGWLQVCATDPKIRALSPNVAGMICAPVATKMFYAGNAETLAWLKGRKYATDIK